LGLTLFSLHLSGSANGERNSSRQAAQEIILDGIYGIDTFFSSRNGEHRNKG
jgi:hypothetical protein